MMTSSDLEEASCAVQKARDASKAAELRSECRLQKEGDRETQCDRTGLFQTRQKLRVGIRRHRIERPNVLTAAKFSSRP